MTGIEIFIPLIVMILFIIIGVPVGYSMLIGGAYGAIFMVGYGPSVGLIQGLLHREVADFTLSTIPMFILMAEFLRESGITSDVYRLLNAWLGHVRGGLAMATTIANGGMGALTGSSSATVAALGNIAVPEMREYNYDDQLSIGTVAAAGTFASMFPPSLGLIILGILTEQSISQLFIAAIIPGILTVIMYILLIVVWASYNPDIAGGVGSKADWKERFGKILPIWPAVVLVTLVLGGIYTGNTTPTEAGAIGALGSWVFLVADEGGVKETLEAVRRALELTGMIFLILIGASLFGVYMATTGFVPALTNAIINLPLPELAIFGVILLMYIAMGAVMSLLAILILTIPIVWPLVVGTWGYNPIWFAIVLIKVIEFGLITPPLGLNVYIATSVVDVDVGTAFRGAVKFLIADLVVLILLFVFPGMVHIL